MKPVLLVTNYKRCRLFTGHRGSPLHPGTFSALAARSLASLEFICLTYSPCSFPSR